MSDLQDAITAAELLQIEVGALRGTSSGRRFIEPLLSKFNDVIKSRQLDLEQTNHLIRHMYWKCLSISVPDIGSLIGATEHEVRQIALPGPERPCMACGASVWVTSRTQWTVDEFSCANCIEKRKQELQSQLAASSEHHRQRNEDLRRQHVEWWSHFRDVVIQLLELSTTYDQVKAIEFMYQNVNYGSSDEIDDVVHRRLTELGDEAI